MKTATKLGFFLGSSAIVIILGYFLTPIKAWKKYKETHPSLFEVKDEATPTYLDFCQSYWKAFIKVSEGKEDELTYDGGELPEVIITPNKE